MYDKDEISSINPKNKNNTEGVEYSPKTSLAFVGSASSTNIKGRGTYEVHYRRV